MKEPYGEGLATHAGPESCVWHPRGCRRSVDRGTCGLGIEPRKTLIRGADPVGLWGRQHGRARSGEHPRGLAWS